MLDRTGDWCFEGGCTYMTDTGRMVGELDTDEMDARYTEPCLGMYD